LYSPSEAPKLSKESMLSRKVKTEITKIILAGETEPWVIIRLVKFNLDTNFQLELLDKLELYLEFIKILLKKQYENKTKPHNKD
jgi:hypothetical protein